MHAANCMFPRWHTLFAYNFLVNGPIYEIQNKILFTLFQNIKKM